MKAIVLAAGVGSRLKDFTDKPKCLLRIGNHSLLSRYFRSLSAVGIDSVIVVTGYQQDLVIQELNSLSYDGHIEVIHNPEFEKGSVLSLSSADIALDDDVLIMDADVYFEEEILTKMCQSKKQSFFLLDTTSSNDGEAVMVGFEKSVATRLARGLEGEYSVFGEMVGFTRLAKSAAQKMKQIITENIHKGNVEIGYEFLYPELFDNFPISFELVDGLKWVEIDFPEDVKKAQAIDAEINPSCLVKS